MPKLTSEDSISLSWDRTTAIKPNYRQAMSWRSSEYYFRCVSAIIENGHQYVIRRLWPVGNPDQLEFHAGDTQNENGKLLPAWQSHVKKWPLTAKIVSVRTKGLCSVINQAGDVKKTCRNTTSGLVSVILENVHHWYFIEAPQAHWKSVPFSARSCYLANHPVTHGTSTDFQSAVVHPVYSTYVQSLKPYSV
jgi:hypothetical protein